jgi:hypothetical protein
MHPFAYLMEKVSPLGFFFEIPQVDVLVRILGIT